VEEKGKENKPISAVNLTKMNLTKKFIENIMAGVYSFIYLAGHSEVTSPQVVTAFNHEQFPFPQHLFRPQIL
jgi:hypothetical protein